MLDNKSVWFYATKFVAICYSSSKKLIQLPLLKGKSELLCRTFRGLMLSSPRLTAWLAMPMCHRSLQIGLLHDPQQPYPVLCQCSCLEHLSSLVCLCNFLILSVSAIIKQYLLCEAYLYFPERNAGLLSCISCLCCFSHSLPLSRL